MALTPLYNRQMALKYIYAFYTGSIDNKVGPLMKSAYAKFQQAYGLVVDRIWGPASDNKLRNLVRELQEILNSHGYNLAIDGLFGPATLEAVKSFQKANGLTVDGIAGVATWAKLRNHALTWDKIKHFKRSEFRCTCGQCNGYPVEPDLKMVKMMDDIRSAYGKPITITSGVRCTYQNKKVGGVSNSMHLKGLAADFYIPGQNDTAAGRNAVVRQAQILGVKYAYANTPGMGNAVHINM